MRFIEKKQQLDYLLELIEKGRCLSLQQIATKFNCSKRTIKRMISILKEDGNDIKYCPLNRKYFKYN